MITNRNCCISRQLVLVAACFFLTLCSFVTVGFAEESGICGKNLSWKIENNVLFISGTGDMSFDSEYAPWYEFRESILRVEIQDGVTSIADSAFLECTKLKVVDIADSVKTIGSNAFIDCSKLVTVNLGTGLKEIREKAFKAAISLKEIKLPEGIEIIGDEAFFYCKSLESITIPSSLKSLGKSVFSYCDSLISINIKANLTEIPTLSFYGCKSLSDVVLSDTIVNVGEDAFQDCNNLNNVSSKEINVLTQKIKNDVHHFGTENDSAGSINNDIFYSEIIDEDDFSMSTIVTADKITIDAEINNNSGWNSLIEQTTTYVEGQKNLGQDSPVEVILDISKTIKVDGDLLKSLAGENVNLKLKNNKIEIDISCNELNSKKDFSDLNLEYSLTKLEETAQRTISVIGDSQGFKLRLKGYTDYDVVVRTNLGIEYSNRIASLYAEDEKGWKLVQAVQVGNDGYASFYLSKFDFMVEFLIGIDVNGIDRNTVIIPEDKYSDYNGLMDTQGNYYEITGVESKWGITLSQFSLIVFGVLGGVIVLVGLVMFIIFKMQQNKERVRREVMSEKKVKKTK